MKRRAWLLLLASAGALAGEGRLDAPLRDPWVPPAVREQVRPAAPTHGSALRAQVERKLRDRFDAADARREGSITREQARAARLGFVDEHFDAIDEARKGRVTFEDVKRYLRARGARTL
jgi:hypothetical protein